MAAITSVAGHTAEWRDGLRVTRMIVEGRNIWLEIVWQGKPVELRIGPRTLKAARVQREPLPLGEMT